MPLDLLNVGSSAIGRKAFEPLVGLDAQQRRLAGGAARHNAVAPMIRSALPLNVVDFHASDFHLAPRTICLSGSIS